MLRFLALRLIAVGITVLGVASLVFFSLHAVPGDPIEVMLGDQVRLADRQALTQSLGLDRPVYEQYLSYLVGLLQGDLGQSIQRNRAVSAIVAERLPETIQLAFTGMLVAVLLALPLGIWAAKYPNQWQDKLSLVLALGGISIPNFVLGPVLVIVFSLTLNWLPSSGSQAVNAWVLPTIALSTAMAAMLSRMLRSSLINIVKEPFVMAARARGNSWQECWNKHILPNALLPVLTVFGLQLGTLLSGAVIVEIVFAWNGIGSLLVEAVEQRDYPLVQACILIISVAYIVTNSLVDILYGLIDPRVR